MTGTVTSFREERLVCHQRNASMSWREQATAYRRHFAGVKELRGANRNRDIVGTNPQAGERRRWPASPEAEASFSRTLSGPDMRGAARMKRGRPLAVVRLDVGRVDLGR